MCRAGNVSRLPVPNTRLTGTERGLLQAVLRESWEERLKGPLPNLIEDFGSSSLSKNGVVDSTDAKTLAEKGKFCLWVLTPLDTFIHGASDI